MTQARHLVIVGGGFAGVHAARALQRRLPDGWELILFSHENHFIFTPLLGDVVGSSINPMHVVWPIRQMVRHASCRTAAVTRIDLADRVVEYQTPQGYTERQHYDQLVLACGSAVKLDIIPGMAAHGFALKTMGDALLLRNQLIGLLEQAEVEPSPALRRQLLSVVVVGAGYSGVEVAGEIMDLLKESRRFYRNILDSDIRVTLLEGRDRILPELPDKLSAFAHRKMSERGIDIRTGALAQSVTETSIRLADGSAIETTTVVCTIGTTANPLLQRLGLPMIHSRVKTLPDMRIDGHPEVWALGDCAAVPNAYDGKLCAPTAQLAVRQGNQLAANIIRASAGQPTRPFSFKPLGMLASIGNHRAVGLVFGVRVSGFIAWFLWRGIYLAKMPTLARKVQIAFDWFWQLFFRRDIVELSLDTTARLGRAHFEAGQFVFHKGDPGDRFYIIERGRAAVYLDEAQPPVAHLGAGEHFGEGSLLRAARRSASVRADEPLDLLVVERHSFVQLTEHLQVLRTALERSVQGSQSAAELLQQAQHEPRLQSLRVRDVMTQPAVCLPVALTLRDAQAQAQALGKGAYPVVDAAGSMVGLCTRTDFYRALQKLSPPETPLAEVMRCPVLTVSESAPLTTALVTFVREPIKRLVVVADDAPARPLGIVTPFDIQRVLNESSPEEQASRGA